MRLGIKGKQVLGVTVIAGALVIALSAVHLAQLASVTLDESRARADLLAKAVFHRAHDVVRAGTTDPAEALRRDPGLRSILEASLYSKNVTSAAIVAPDGVVIVHADAAQEGRRLSVAPDLDLLLRQSPLGRLRAIYEGRGRNVDLVQPLLVDDQDFGAIRIGVSTLLMRDDLNTALRPAWLTALGALLVAMFGATILAQVVLRPIHVIRSGLTRLQRGEQGVRLDLDRQDEFGEIGSFFNDVTAQLATDRARMAGHVANLESAVEQLEDAVLIVGVDGDVLFANPALHALWPQAVVGARLSDVPTVQESVRQLVAQTLASRQAGGPLSVAVSRSEGDTADRLVLTHPVPDHRGGLMGVMLIVRNLDYLGQVESTLRYSQKLAALGRLSAGIAHEIKNPLNAMMIHLELLRHELRTLGRESPPGGFAPETAEALSHITVIAAEIKRLDEVVQGFLRFTRPQDLDLQPTALAVLFEEVVRVTKPEAERLGITLRVDCDGALAVHGDAGLLRQAFLNLALNACQAMPAGGTLSVVCAPARGRRIAITIADTGEGIAPEHLEKIFNLYFSTKSSGSGIGLSMVYRTIQLHDGEIAVQSTLGQGTTFTITLPQAV